MRRADAPKTGVGGEAVPCLQVPATVSDGSSTSQNCRSAAVSSSEFHNDGSPEDIETVEDICMTPPKPAEVSWSLPLAQGGK